MGETEAVFANAEQQGGVEVGAADHGGFGEAPDGEVLALWGTLTQMVTGGGEDLVGVGGHGERGGHVLRLTAFVSAVVDAMASSSVYCAHAEPVPLPALRLFTVAVATWDQKTREGMILLVNRDEHNAHDVTIDLTSLPGLGEWPSVTSSQMLLSDDIYRTNTADEPDGVTLQPLSAALDEGRMTVSLPPVTWASVRFTA